jgi:hypothetical protein
VPKVQATMRIVLFHFLRLGLCVNFSAGKTECVITFRNQNSKKARLNAESQDAIPIQRPDGTKINLTCCESYRHVGSRFVTGNRLMPEIRTKNECY